MNEVSVPVSEWLGWLLPEYIIEDCRKPAKMHVPGPLTSPEDSACVNRLQNS